MKIWLLGIAFILLGPSDKPPRFKYLDRTGSLYITVKGLPKGTDDPVSAFIKDSLRKAGFKIVSFEENIEAVKQFTAAVSRNSKQLSPNDLKTRESYIEKLFSNVPTIQTLGIFYIRGKDSSGTFESFDEIGFRHSQLPSLSGNVSNAASFTVKKIGSNSADSVARYLLKKM